MPTMCLVCAEYGGLRRTTLTTTWRETCPKAAIFCDLLQFSLVKSTESVQPLPEQPGTVE